jgi:hypothetical protein
MMAILNAKWHRIAALIWLMCGFVVTVLMPYAIGEQFLVGYMIWLFLGWLAPVLILGISGLRSGSFANRVCAVVAIITLAAFIFLALTPSLSRA